jgi:hypothetical protein
MDETRFDALTRSLSTPGSRRRAVGGILTAVVGLLRGLELYEGTAHDPRKRCKKLKGEKKRKCLKQAKAHNATHTTASSCGPCPLIGQVCNAAGQCACPADKPEVCRGACAASCTTGVTVRNPENCRCCIPSGDASGGSRENCCSENQSSGICLGHLRPAPCSIHEQCNSHNCVYGTCEDCTRLNDYCNHGTGGSCGPLANGRCLETVDGKTRCGVRSQNVDCNVCSNDIDCQVELGQGSGAFCAIDTGVFCDCPDGETFCALPR